MINAVGFGDDLRDFESYESLQAHGLVLGGHVAWFDGRDGSNGNNSVLS